MTPAEAAIREALEGFDPNVWTYSYNDNLDKFRIVSGPREIEVLLSELDALRARCEAHEALLREVRVDGRLIISGSDIDQRIDAHLKGANHG